MFTIKKSSKNKFNKKSTRKGGKSINKPELSVDLDIDTSIDASNKGFTLSRGINRKLEKGHIDHVVNQEEVIRQGQVSTGKEFDNPLNNQLIMDYFGIDGMDSHASYLDPEKYVNSRGQDQLDMLARASGSTNGSVLAAGKYGYKIYDTITGANGNIETALTIVGGTKKDRICLVLETTTETVGAAAGIPGGALGILAGQEAGAFVGQELCRVSKGEKTLTQKAWEWVKSLFTMPNPEDPNGGAPVLSNRAAKLINSYLEKHGNTMMDSLRNLDLDIDPLENGNDQDNTGYLNPTLVAIEFSNGGTSTGAWEISGGAYLGPNIDAVNDSLGGTSTGDTPLI